MKNPKIAIIIPTYKEAKNIKILVEQIFKLLRKANIVVVDDNSPDGTKNLVNDLKKKYKNLHLITRQKKAGRGSAVLAGFTYALRKFKADYYLEMDADLSHPAKQISQLVAATSSQTIAIASRYLVGGKIVAVPWFRKILSGIANQFIRAYLKTCLQDNSNGFRCYPKKAIEVMLSHHFKTSGYIVLSETIVLLKKHGFAFKEIPTIFVNRKRGQSNTDFKEAWSAWCGLRKIRKSGL